MRIRKSFKYLAIICCIFLLPLLIILYVSIFGTNIQEMPQEKTELFIGENKTLNTLLNDTASLGGLVKRKNSLLMTARLKRYTGNIKPGMYVITQDMSNNDLINIFRSGMQKPITVTFNNIRTKADLAGNLSHQLRSDSLDILAVLNDQTFLKEQGFNTYTAVCPFLPDSYEMYWTILPESLYERMVYEYNNFWDGARLSKAKNINLSPEEVITLASIVNEESNFVNEQPVIAGLYLNRIKRGYLLQADPTLKFALNDFDKKRVLNEDKKIDSPYNTYRFKGLPPGPIRIPSKASVDAVLNYKKHNYLYMCAKADFSGEHHFSETLREHLRYAREYQRKLNQLKIYN